MIDHKVLAEKIQKEKEEHGHFAPLYIMLGENVYREVEESLKNELGDSEVGGISAIYGVPICINVSDVNTLGIFYKLW